MVMISDGGGGGDGGGDGMDLRYRCPPPSPPPSWDGSDHIHGLMSLWVLVVKHITSEGEPIWEGNTSLLHYHPSMDNNYCGWWWWW